MSTIKLFNNSGTTKAFASLEGFVPRYELLSEVVRAEQSNLRSGNAHTKTKGEVSGGGKKPWKQKGTGRARHGSSRSPIWKGGGVTHGPRNTTNWHLKINKSARMCALKSILQDRISDESVYQLKDSYEKTKVTVEAIAKFNEATKSKAKNIIIIYTTEEKDMVQGFTNTEAHMINANQLAVYKLVARPFLVFTPKATELLEARFEANKTTNSYEVIEVTEGQKEEKTKKTSKATTKEQVK
jgi:large subunit ribosomal protein L4